MAVKPEIIKARLKVLFPKANLSTKRLDALAAKLAPMPADGADDAAVDVILNQSNDFNSFEEIAREDDRVRTLEAKVNPVPTPTPTPEPTPSPNPEPSNPNDVNQKLLEAITKLTGEVEAIKTGKITDTKKQTAQSAFEASDILKALKPEIKNSWLSRIDVNSETTIEDQIKGLETEYSDIRQSFADNTRYSGPTPSGTSGKDEPSAEDVKSIVDSLI